MEASNYTTLTRQLGLLREMQTVANNIANMSTTGYKSEGVVFAEHIHAAGRDHSVSMASGVGRRTDLSQGVLRSTENALDLAIEGDGFFKVSTAEGPRLTRAGAFSVDAQGVIVAPDGAPLLDVGDVPIVLPVDARSIGIGQDGTVSADDVPVAQIGVWYAPLGTEGSRTDGVRFAVEGTEPVDTPHLRQGALEASNVEPVRQIARMIEVQRAYEWGQTFLDREDDRIRSTIRTIGE